MWNSRPPPSWKKNILDFHFDYLHTSLSHSPRQSQPDNGQKTISCITHRHHFAKFANFEDVLAELVSVLSLTSAPLCISYYKQSKLYRVVSDGSRQLEWARYPILGLF